MRLEQSLPAEPAEPGVTFIESLAWTAVLGTQGAWFRQWCIREAQKVSRHSTLHRRQFQDAINRIHKERRDD